MRRLIRFIVGTPLAGALLVAGCALVPAAPAPAPADGALRITSVEPGLVDGLLVVRFELLNRSDAPVLLVDGLAPPSTATDIVVDPLVVVAPTLDGVAEVRKGGLPAPERRPFLVANVPVLTSLEPGERFSDTVRVTPPPGGVRSVRLRVEYATGVAASPGETAAGRVLTAPYALVFSARRGVESQAIDLPSPLDVGFD